MVLNYSVILLSNEWFRHRLFGGKFMWKCPKCKRRFQSKNQSHSCVIVKEKDLFLNSNRNVIEIYNLLKSHCQGICAFKIDTTKSCLYFVDQQRFLAIKPKKSGLILEYMLNRIVDRFPVIKIVEIGKFRYAHRLMLDQPEDLNFEVLGWIEEAHSVLQK